MPHRGKECKAQWLQNPENFSKDFALAHAFVRHNISAKTKTATWKAANREITPNFSSTS